jgi:hypothetical protein
MSNPLGRSWPFAITRDRPDHHQSDLADPQSDRIPMPWPDTTKQCLGDEQRRTLCLTMGRSERHTQIRDKGGSFSNLLNRFGFFFFGLSSIRLSRPVLKRYNCIEC